MTFHSNILILPGLGSSAEQHWQSLWEKQFPNFTRVVQQDWETPRREDWVETLDQAIAQFEPGSVILVAHSLACMLVAYWAQQYNRPIKGALLIAPSDTEANTYPSGTKGFTPVPTEKLSFPSLVVASTNDFYVTLERATHFADNWGSGLINIGEAGHINVAAGFGKWDFGLELLKRLD
jgi:predicted alpha/beta hydrolase family esterase